MRFLKDQENKSLQQGEDTGAMDGEFGVEDNNGMDIELPEGMDDELQLRKNDSIQLRRFDPDYYPLDLSRGVSLIHTMSRNLGRNPSANDLDNFMREQQGWLESQRSRNESSNNQDRGSMMMEEFPTKPGTLDIHPPPLQLQNTYSFLAQDQESDEEFNSPVEKSGGQSTNSGGIWLLPQQVTNQEPDHHHDADYRDLEDNPNKKYRTAADEIFSVDGEPVGGRLPPGIREPISCHCTKSECLKLYCQCFRLGYACGSSCKCENCLNTSKNFEHVNILRQQKINRKTPAEESFCNCKMSFCEKSYCVCARNGTGCSKLCTCFNCKNPKGAKRSGGR